MQSEAPLADHVILDALDAGWGLTPERLAYAPLGYGSWHWHAESSSRGRLFVTVDEVRSELDLDTSTRPTLAELEWAYGVPLALTRAATSFARPPIPTLAGKILVAVNGRWVLSLWPLIDGRATHEGRYATGEDATAVVQIVRLLHEMPIDLFGGRLARQESFGLPGIERLLELIDNRWPGPHVGPYSAAAEELLHRHARDIRGLASLYEDLVQHAPPIEEWVVTHGEPHAANVVFTDRGPVLIDWDTAKIAPKERDLWMIAADGFSVGDAEPEMLRLYRAQWDLRELTDYAIRFSNPDDDGPVGDPAWNDFTQYLDRAAHV